MDWIQWAFIILFFIGINLIVFTILSSIKFTKNRRITYKQEKRKSDFLSLFNRLVKIENERPANYKLRRKLKIAGYPFRDPFRYRLFQLLSVFILGFSMFFYIAVNRFLGSMREFPIILFIFIIIAGYFTPLIIVAYRSYTRRKLLSSEIVRFSHRLTVGVGDGVSLYYAIKRAARTTNHLKPYIDDMLLDWTQNPKKAIEKFGKDVGLNEVMPLVNTLLATWQADNDKIVELFQQQIRLIDNMRDYHIKKNIEVSPLAVVFIVFLPFTCDVLLILAPWNQYVIEILNTSF